MMMTLNLMMMNKPKYEIGDYFENTGFVVRGVMLTSKGFRYFVQVNKSDNSIVINEDDIDSFVNFSFEELKKDVESA